MVKCTCGRVFHNMGKMRRHFARFTNPFDPAQVAEAPRHVPDMGHDATRKSHLGYTKSHKKGRK